MLYELILRTAKKYSAYWVKTHADNYSGQCSECEMLHMVVTENEQWGKVWNLVKRFATVFIFPSQFSVPSNALYCNHLRNAHTLCRSWISSCTLSWQSSVLLWHAKFYNQHGMFYACMLSAYAVSIYAHALKHWAATVYSISKICANIQAYWVFMLIARWYKLSRATNLWQYCDSMLL